MRHDTVSLDAAVVTRRRRRVTSFAFPSGGAPTGASLHLRLPLRRRRPRRRVRYEYADCIYGTDCADCGPRFPRQPPICAETCNWASDDCDDCGPGSEFRPAPGRRHVDHRHMWICDSMVPIMSGTCVMSESRELKCLKCGV